MPVTMYGPPEINMAKAWLCLAANNAKMLWAMPKSRVMRPPILSNFQAKRTPIVVPTTRIAIRVSSIPCSVEPCIPYAKATISQKNTIVVPKMRAVHRRPFDIRSLRVVCVFISIFRSILIATGNLLENDRQELK